MSQPTTIDEYIDAAPPLGRDLLSELRSLSRETVPDAVEQIKWGHPAYVHPDGVILFMFSGHKAHASMAFTPSTKAAFEAELTQYRTGKGTVVLPYVTTPPWPLLTRMIEYRVREHEDDGVNWM
ncbi:MAG: iron chaperone [Dietzia sp.]